MKVVFGIYLRAFQQIQPHYPEQHFISDTLSKCYLHSNQKILVKCRNLCNCCNQPLIYLFVATEIRVLGSYQSFFDQTRCLNRCFQQLVSTHRVIVTPTQLSAQVSLFPECKFLLYIPTLFPMQRVSHPDLISQMTLNLPCFSELFGLNNSL